MPTKIELTDDHLPLEVTKTGLPEIHDADGNLIVTVWPNPTGKGALARARNRAEIIKAALTWAESLADVRAADLRIQQRAGEGTQ